MEKRYYDSFEEDEKLKPIYANGEYLDFSKEDEVLSNFINSKGSSENSREKEKVGVLSHINVGEVKKTVINNFELNGRKYIITSYLDQNKERIIEIYNYCNEKLNRVNKDDKIYILIQKVLREREKQKEQLTSRRNEKEL